MNEYLVTGHYFAGQAKKEVRAIIQAANGMEARKKAIKDYPSMEVGTMGVAFVKALTEIREKDAVEQD